MAGCGDGKNGETSGLFLELRTGCRLPFTVLVTVQYNIPSLLGNGFQTNPLQNVGFYPSSHLFVTQPNSLDESPCSFVL
ncbi:hypothetical protein, partial [Meiothermus hypogaeus]|uniref:hypothetical protein n=1 Tax=Meiothermus hypogaeus TaxID=884155 RepID=UPI00197F9D03